MIPEHENCSPEFGLGDRVRMNAFGLSRHPKYKGRTGIVVGKGSPNSWRIKFDERRTIQAIHHTYLELVAAASKQRTGIAVVHQASLEW